MPPQLALPQSHIFVVGLVAHILLVVSDMEEPRIVEYRNALANQIGTGTVVFFRAKHPPVISEPLVMHRRKIEFRNRL